MKNVLLIGLGRFGANMVKELSGLGCQVMAVDISEERVNDALNYITRAQIGDSTKREFLKSIGVKNFDLCVVTISDNFQSSLETTSLLKELDAKFIVSRAANDAQEKFLRLAGADDVVYPESQMAKWAAIRYGLDNILDYIELDNNHAIIEVNVPKAWIGKSIGELEVRRKFGINIMGIKQNNVLNVEITPDTVLGEDKTLFVVGEYRSLQKCFKL